ncbi:HNH endonuclease signature motif containing protein [Pelagerythrobacter marinus]|uniref:HNH endonuclease signature motif containing protein n=1 Tax=Pelagerythrobacter marinus TaxID=538382 RepID=UPI002AC9D0F6|nr:HNH endonuclease signature motif containing protein [Pelagerythrobacter marinus]WPZ05488.1 HNH endonuclease signature motif containing protein [Pelagerythrobacter marinus]
MAKKPLPTPEQLRQLLRYEPETGKLYWRERPADLFQARGKFPPEHGAKVWNARWAGAEAFTAVAKEGYHVGAINFRTMRAHRVIWAIVYGAWPVGEIDHINGIRSDNRLCNLRVVSPSANRKNMKRRKDNPSGATGVYWWPTSRKWRVQIKSCGERRHIGMFDTFEEAVAARKAAEAKHGFHRNHGRPA